MLQNIGLNRIPKVIFSNLTLRSNSFPCSFCSTATAADKIVKNEENKRTEITWNTIYNFPLIRITASLKRLKFYPTAAAGVTVPISWALAHFGHLSLTTAQVCGTLGLTATTTLCLFSWLSSNLVGFVYTNDDMTQVKISYVDFWGKRHDKIYLKDDIIPTSELPKELLGFYFRVRNHNDNDAFTLVHKMGGVYHKQAFKNIFGENV